MSRIEDLEKRLSADPSSKIFVQLAEEYRKAGLPEDAIATCRDGLEKHPNYFSARVALGRALLETNAFEEARGEFEKVLKQVPDNLLALKFLGETLHKLGRLDEALSKYQLASTLSPEDVDLSDRTKQVQAASAAAQAGHSPVADPAVPPGEQSTPRTIPPAKAAAELIERQAREMGSQSVSDDVLSMQEEFEDRPVTSIFHRQAREIQDLGAIPLPARKAPEETKGQPGTPPVPPPREAAPPPAPRETATIDLGGAKIKKPLGSIPAPPGPERMPFPSGPPSPPIEAESTPEPEVVPMKAVTPPPAAPVLPGAPSVTPVATPKPEGGSASGFLGAGTAAAEDDRPGLATTTLAELYISQGHLDRAVQVYRQLVASNPNNPQLQSRLEELEMLATASSEPERSRTASPRPAGGTSDTPPNDTPNVRFLEQAIRELEGWLAAIGRS
jgi:tetratricopeptide (TPR) repeat protein